MESTGFTNPNLIKVNDLVRVCDNVKPPARSSLTPLIGKIGLVIGFKGSLCYVLFDDGISQLYTYLLECVK